MACPEVTIQSINGSECIGDSLPKINTNFSTLGDAACDLITKVTALSSSVTSLSSTKANNLSVVDSTTIDLSYNSFTGTLSADVTTSYLLSSNFTGTNQSLASHGYQKLPGRLIIQWGNALVPGSTGITITYPQSFPNATLAALVSKYGTLLDSVTLNVVSFNASTITLDNSVEVNTGAMWFAIGY
jgi:hypothetical protein